jgi:tetratricopeptide (TPR) repeat protein
VEAQKGRLALSAKRYGEALDLFQAAVKMCPDEPSYHFQIGKTLYLQALDQLPADKPIPDGVRKPLLKAQALDPHYDDPRLYQGYISKRNGDAKRALKEFKGALECNPNNKLAQSEVRLLKRRLGET